MIKLLWTLKKIKKNNKIEKNTLKKNIFKIKKLQIITLFRSLCIKQKQNKLFVQNKINHYLLNLDKYHNKQKCKRKIIATKQTDKTITLLIKNKKYRFNNILNNFFTNKKLMLLKDYLTGTYSIFFFKNAIKTNIVAADFNSKSKQLVFKKKEVINTFKVNLFKRKQILKQIKKKALKSNFNIEYKLLSTKFINKKKTIKFYIQHTLKKNNSISSNSYYFSCYKEINYKIKQVTLIPTVLKSSNNQKNISSLPTKIPTFFINFMYKHN